MIKKLDSFPTTDNSLISCETPPSKEIQKYSDCESKFPSPKKEGLFKKGRKTETLVVNINSREDLDEIGNSIILDNCEGMMAKLRQRECQTPRR